MHLSTLLIDIGADPDRPRPGRLWLRNLYHVHQRLCMAFPSVQRKSVDADFLLPYHVDDFGSGHVKVERDQGSGFLYRIDTAGGGRAIVLVQSAIQPDWEYAFHNAGHLLAALPESKTVDPHFETGARLQFRLQANPTKKIGTPTKAERLGVTKELWKDQSARHGRRVPVRPDESLDWLVRRAESGGFAVDEERTGFVLGYVSMSKKRDGHECKRLRSARFDGVLRVTDADAFRQTIIRGIGPGKAFGFGLLSVAPFRDALKDMAP